MKPWKMRRVSSEGFVAYRDRTEFVATQDGTLVPMEMPVPIDFEVLQAEETVR